MKKSKVKKKKEHINDELQVPSHIAEVVERLNSLHAVVPIGGKVLIMTERPSPSFLGRIDRTFLQKADLQLLYAADLHQVGLGAGGQVKVQTADQIWLSSPKRRQYNSLIFDPNKPPGGDDEAHVYNLWRGWPLADVKKPPSMKRWKGVHDFIRDIIAGGDTKLFRWVCAWMAARFKNPGRTGAVALVLMGDEGIGKGFFAKHIMGGSYDLNHFVHITDGQHITGRFNGHLSDSLMVFVDEAFYAGDPSVAGKLKGLITEETVLLEAKFQNPIQFPNMRSFIIASNEMYVVPAGRAARRFAVLKVSEARKQQRRYFEALRHELYSGGRLEMLRWLGREDFSDVDPYTAPVTVALTEQKKLSFSNTERYWFDRMQKGRLPDAIGNDPGIVWDDKKEAQVPIMAAVQHYLSQPYMQRAYAREIRAAETELGITLNALIPSRKKERPTKGGERSYIWILPPLKQARQEFERLSGGGDVWKLSM
jgi:hypothetical protein